MEASMPAPQAALRSLLVVALLGTVGLAGCFTDDAAPGATSAAQTAQSMLDNPPGADVKPTGKTKEFNLYLHRMRHVLYPGASMNMWGFSLSDDPNSAQFPGPTLRVTEGDKVVVRFLSTVAGFNHTLHFHGQHVPWDMDGVPYVTQEPVEPGEEFVYTFIAKPAGTYWYHCHVDAQHHIDMGMYGAFIVDPQDRSTEPRYDDDFVLMLDDMDRFHLEGGDTNVNNTPQSGDPFDYEAWARRQAQDTYNRNAVIQENAGSKARPTRNWYPVTYAPFTVSYNTYLINGAAFPYTEPIVVKEGETVRLRLINAGNTFFAMHLHGHHFLVTHKDGIALNSPYWADTVFIGPSERYDVYVKLNNPGPWDFHDHAATHTQNDNIFPGGAMMMFVYEGFEDLAMGHGHAHGGSSQKIKLPATGSSGDYIRWYAET
ncbi:MAG TPA: multicopper oxidase family protein [Candidatus Thermoplasmatota archaeon]|nr:multicopper oxidase family protein [Candidatus Thermoplasmatota archaeon]